VRGGRGIGKEGKRNERRKEMEKRGEETREGKEREERRGESNTPLLFYIPVQYMHIREWTIARYETPSLHTAIEMSSGIVTAMGRDLGGS